MADIIDFTKHKIEKSSDGIYYIMDQEKWNPLAFVAGKNLFLSIQLSRIIRHNSKKYDFLITDETPCKILLYNKEDKTVNVWKSEHELDSGMVEQIFGNSDKIEKIVFNIHEMGMSTRKFENISEVIENIGGSKYNILPDRNPK